MTTFVLKYLSEDENADMIVCLLQSNYNADCLYHMAYGLSDTLAEFLNGGECLWDITKIYSINIVYSSPSKGEGYVYRGITNFTNIKNHDDELKLSFVQSRATLCKLPFEIFPEYYLIRLDRFKGKTVTPLDEWISFLKTGEIPVDATAPGLSEARERLRIDSLSDEEKKDYHRMMENLRYQRSVIETGRFEGREQGLEEGREEGLKEGREEGREEGLKEGLKEGIAKEREEQRIHNIIHLRAKGYDDTTIADLLDLNIEFVKQH